MQEEHTATLQLSVQQAVAVAVSGRDEDMLALHQQLEEGEAHFQAELDEAHAQLLDSQNTQHKLEQQLRDSEAKRYASSQQHAGYCKVSTGRSMACLSVKSWLIPTYFQ